MKSEEKRREEVNIAKGKSYTLGVVTGLIIAEIIRYIFQFITQNP